MGKKSVYHRVTDKSAGFDWCGFAAKDFRIGVTVMRPQLMTREPS